jgi:hypothetical protein
MYAVTALIGFLAPILFGTWIGTLAGRPMGGFFLGWVATPITAVVAMLLLFATIQTPFATIVAVESPIVGLGTGLLSGGFSAFFVHRRLATSDRRPIGEQEKDIVVSDSLEQ